MPADSCRNLVEGLAQKERERQGNAISPEAIEHVKQERSLDRGHTIMV